MRLFDDPLKTIVDGMVQARGIRQQMLQARMEQARAKMMERDMQRREEDSQRSRQMQDIQFQQQLVQNARPVSGAGTVTERTQLDTRLEGLPSSMQPGMVNVQNERAVNPGSAVTFNGKQYELLSQGDIDARDVERARLMGAQQNAQFLDRFRGQAAITDQYTEKDRDLRRELQSGQISAREYIAEMQARAEAAKVLQQQNFQRGLEEMRQGFQATQNDKNRNTTLTAAQIRKAGGGGGANDQGLIDAVSANPALFESLTPTVKTRILPSLAAAGVQLPGRPLSGEASKVVGVAQTMLPEVDALMAAMRAPDFRMRMTKVKLGLDPELSRLVDNVADKVGRLRSGGAVNKNEEERFRGQILRWVDIGTGDNSGALQGLQGLRSEAESVLSQMNRGGAAPSGGGGNPYRQQAAPVGGGVPVNPYR